MSHLLISTYCYVCLKTVYAKAVHLDVGNAAARGDLTGARRGIASHGERGQTTAEYAMVIIAAAAIAALLLAWATKTDAISRLLDRVIELILPG